MMARSRLPFVALAGLALGSTALFAMTRPAPPRQGVLPNGTLVARDKPLIVGVGVHFGIGGEFGYEPEPTARAIADLGVGSFRDDVPWMAFKQRGLAAPGDISARQRAVLAATPARPLWILTYTHPAVAGGKAPATDAARTAFAAFNGEAVKVTAPRDPIVEIWNEWNLNAAPERGILKGAGTADDPRSGASYAKLANASTQAIRAARPKATVLVGAAGMDPDWQWVRSVIDHGGLRRASGLSVHYYNQCAPVAERTGADAIAKMEALHAVLPKPGGRPMPVYVTEIGWPTTTGGACGDIPADTGASNIAQFLLWSAATPWVAGVWVYQLKDQGRRPNEMEDVFGLYTYDYKPKPAACTVREATALAGQGQAWRVDRSQPGITMLRQRTAKGTRMILWTDAPDDRLTVTFAQPVRFRALCGTAGNGAAVPVGYRPVVIDLGSSAAATPRYRRP
jgi:hypothetical protein